MTIQSSNFAKSGTLVNAVSIATGHPKWFNGACMPELYPGWQLVKQSKARMITHREYVNQYVHMLETTIDPVQLVQKLSDKVILCWCKSDSFCHRHILAAWLHKKTGVLISEI